LFFFFLKNFFCRKLINRKKKKLKCFDSRRGRGRGRGRGGRGRGRGGRGGPPRNAAVVRRNRESSIRTRRSTGTEFLSQKGSLDDSTVWEHDLFDEEEEEEEEEEEVEFEQYQPIRGGGGRGGADGTKVLISNLEYTVNERNLKEVFENFGYSIRKVVIHYDKSGRSDGTADIFFNNRTEAAKAVSAYNGISIEGKPITLVLKEEERGVMKIGGLSVSTGRSNGAGPRRFRTSQRSDVREIRFSRTRGSFGRGRGGRGRGRGGRRNSTPATQEDLDKELEEYLNTE